MSTAPIIEEGPGWKLICGDCLDPVYGMASLGDRSVASVITDPPYEAEAHTLQRRVKRGGNAQQTREDGRIAYVEPLSFEPLSFEPLSFEVRSGLAREAGRIARRWVLTFGQVEAAMTWRDALVAAGLSYRRTGVWVKPDGMPQYSGDRPAMGYESLVICHAPGRSRWNGGGKHGVWIFNKNDFPRTGHETQKPLPLMEALVSDFTDPGDLVCDPFSGSATTGVACIRLGRRFIGWERDPRYFEVAVKRLRAAREQYRLPLATGPAPTQASLAIPSGEGVKSRDPWLTAGDYREIHSLAASCLPIDVDSKP